MLSIIKSKDCIKDYLAQTHKSFDLETLYAKSKEDLKTLSETVELSEAFMEEQLKRNLRHLTDFSVLQVQKKPRKRKTISPYANEKSGFLQ